MTSSAPFSWTSSKSNPDGMPLIYENNVGRLKHYCLFCFTARPLCVRISRNLDLLPGIAGLFQTKSETNVGNDVSTL